MSSLVVVVKGFRSDWNTLRGLLPVGAEPARRGILRTTIAPAPSFTRPADRVRAAGRRRRQQLDYVRVLEVELFAVGGRLLANEVTPACTTRGTGPSTAPGRPSSDSHLRAIAVALRSTAARQPVAMVNLISALSDVGAVLAVPGAQVHVYGARRRRRPASSSTSPCRSSTWRRWRPS